LHSSVERSGHGQVKRWGVIKRAWVLAIRVCAVRIHVRHNIIALVFPTTGTGRCLYLQHVIDPERRGSIPLVKGSRIQLRRGC
jgi:hypothetical protein